MQKEIDGAINELEKAGLSRERKKVVSKEIVATNTSEVAYSVISYRKGLYDVIKLILEINQISRNGNMLKM